MAEKLDQNQIVDFKELLMSEEPRPPHVPALPITGQLILKWKIQWREAQR
ncbi:MAG TPA: hypothetical protein PLP18_06795 [Smithellaceae bacterium]|nr:hypothetical protein [Smithellaceae bacterium]